MTKANKRNLFKAGIGYTIGNYLLKGAVFITTPIFARLMTKADYGKYSVFVSYESIFFVVIGLAIHSSYKNAYHKFRDGNNSESELGYQKYISVTMLFLLISLAFWMLVSTVFGNQLSNILGIDKQLLQLLVAGSMATEIMNCYSTDKGIHFQYKSILIISAISTLTSVGLSLWFINTIFSERMYMGRILGNVVPVVAICGFIAVKYLLRTSPKGMGSALFWGIRYSLPIVPHGISQVILTQFDRIMILRLIGDSEAGIYSFAYTIYTMVAVTASSIDGIWSPWFYEQRKANNEKAINRGSSIYILIIFLASVAVIFGGPELIWILGGEKYKDAIYCAIPVVAGGFFAGIYNVPCLVEYYHEKTKLIAISTVSAASLNIILNAFFIKRFGYIAAAYTTLFTYIVYFGAHYAMAKKIEGKDLFPHKLILVCAVVLSGSMFFSLLFISNILVRALLLTIILVFSVRYEEKHYSLMSTWLKNRSGYNSF